MSVSRLKDYCLLYAAFFIYSFVSVFAKFASEQETLIKTLFFMGIEVCMLGSYAIIYQQAIKKFPLVVAMSNKGVALIISLLWSILIFHERITLWNVIGATMIIFGIWMVSSE